MEDAIAIKRATAAAGICVTRAGAAQSIPYAAEVEAAMRKIKDDG